MHHKDLISVAAENYVFNQRSDGLWSCHSLQTTLQELRRHDEWPDLVRVVLRLQVVILHLLEFLHVVIVQFLRLLIHDHVECVFV